MRGLSGKVLVIAGAGGIGTATAVRLAEEGASVVVGDLYAEAAEAAAEQARRAGGKAVAVAMDIADETSVRELVQLAVKTYGGVDGMFANAANIAILPRDGDALTLSLEDFDSTVAVNLRGHLICTKQALPELLKRGGGAIVYTSSAAAYMGEDVRLAYAITKNGLHGLLRHVASRWGKQGIRANAVAPGMVLTPQLKKAMAAEILDAVMAITRSPRAGDGKDIAAMVAMLMSDDGEWINGQVMGVNGGVFMGA
jgi:NAD(P)-dependent dehydrogenase (short-subunit alcohol dehydrogenase family)